MESSRSAWISQAEAALRGLRDVESAAIQTEGDDVREVHVLTSSSRPARLIVRDVQTLLLTRFRRVIDHRVVSVAFTEPGAPHADHRAGEHAAAPAPAVPAASAVEERPGFGAERPAAEPAITERIRFGSANLFVTGPRIQAQVELRWKGLPRLGSASGHGTRDAGHRLVAQAVLGAVQEFLEDDVALALEGLEFSRIGSRDVAIVGVQLVVHREHKSLVGCCTVEQDMPQAVALATLAAVNRVLGGLPTREPTEYVLRPTSM